MARQKKRPTWTQMDLLGWVPSNPVVAYVADRVKASSFSRSVSKAVAETLKNCGRPRAAVAEAMSDYLGETVSENILNGYAAEGRDDLIINLVRLDALLAVTKDRRLLQLIAERHGWAVVEGRHLAAIQLAEAHERRAAADRDIDTLRRRLKSE